MDNKIELLKDEINEMVVQDFGDGSKIIKHYIPQEIVDKINEIIKHLNSK